MVTAPPREIRVPGAMLWYWTEPRPEKETLRPRLSSRNRASLSPMPEDNSTTQNYDCLLGTPFMTRYKKIIINLNDMWIFLEGNNIKE